MKTKIRKIFEVERMIQMHAGLTAGKLGYGLSRNAIRMKEVTASVREQCKSDGEVRKYFNDIQGKPQEKIDELRKALKPEDLKEVERIETLEQELLDSDTEIEWYKIPLLDVPGMKEDDPPEKGVLPMAALMLFMEVGLIDEEPQEKPEKKRNLKPVE